MNSFVDCDPTMHKALSCVDLERVFNELFAQTEKTVLVGAEGEPFYRASAKAISEVCYVKDSLPSALHEIAHWCVAGKERRAKDDYGYWYNPDGRNPEQQRIFEHLEVKPQAMEWLLSVAVGREFVVSCDNLRGKPYDLSAFRHRIYEQACAYVSKDKSQRFLRLLHALQAFCETEQFCDLYWLRVMEHKILPAI